MVGPFGDWIKYSYDDSIYLIPEVDGVRVISSDKCEFLQKVPSNVYHFYIYLLSLFMSVNKYLNRIILC